MSLPGLFKSFFGPMFACAWMLVFATSASGADILSEDFATLTDTAVPAGWSTSGSSDLDYAGAGYYGLASPAYKFKVTGQWLASPSFATGAATLQFWALGNNGEGSTIVVSGMVSGVWTLVDTKSIAQGGGTYNVMLNPQTTQLKFTFIKVVNCALDDIVIQGTSEDPNLSAPSTLSFGTIAPGARSTQTLALANSGASKTLHLTSLSPTSGDTNKFSVGFVSTSLGPGASTNISVVYTPGAVSGVFHSANFNLISDDPSTPSHSMVFSGQTIGASLSVSNVQYSGSGTNSPQMGKRVTVSGIATYVDPKGYAISDAGGGPWSGIYVQDVNHRPEIGDQVLVDAWVAEVDSMTILNTVNDYQTLGTGFSVPATTIQGNQLATEAYEGVYVRIANVTVNDINVSGQKKFWQVTDGSSVLVGTRVPYRYIWHLNDALDAVQGIVFIEGATCSVQPRNDWDLIGRPVFKYALRGLVMTPDGPRTNWYVHVEDDLIMAVTNIAPVGISVVDTGGIIYPGLIDAHNHPGWNSFPTLMFNDFPFGHRDQWAATPEYSDWSSRQKTVQNNAAVNDSLRKTIFKYAECLELMAGCIAIQGSSSAAEYAHPDVILYNVEQFPSRVWPTSFPGTPLPATVAL